MIKDLDLNEVAARIAELRQDAAAMTEAPWFQVNPPFGDGVLIRVKAEDAGGAVVCDCDVGFDPEADDLDHVANAAGIARTRNSLASTADMLEALVGEAVELRRMNGNQYADLGALRTELARVRAQNDALRSVNENSAGVIAGLRGTCDRLTASHTETTNAYEERILELEADNATHEARLRDLDAINTLMVDEINAGRIDPHTSEPGFVARLQAVATAADAWRLDTCNCEEALLDAVKELRRVSP